MRLALKLENINYFSLMENANQQILDAS